VPCPHFGHAPQFIIFTRDPTQNTIPKLGHIHKKINNSGRLLEVSRLIMSWNQPNLPTFYTTYEKTYLFHNYFSLKKLWANNNNNNNNNNATTLHLPNGGRASRAARN
jgi:hypothetical protein